MAVAEESAAHQGRAQGIPGQARPGLLFRRRGELGFGDSRPRFPLVTCVNKRYQDDLENARRSNFDQPSSSTPPRDAVAVAWGEADALMGRAAA